MSDSSEFEQAYLREKRARLLAERLLDEKTRELYENVEQLQSLVDRLKSTQAQLVQSEKMASIGQLSAGVAHEINNPIGFSSSNMETLQSYLQTLFRLDEVIVAGDDKALLESARNYLMQRQAMEVDFIKEDAQGLLDDSIDGLRRVRDIVENLKRISHRGGTEFEACDVNAIIEDCMKLMGNQLRFNMQVDTALQSTQIINGNASELSQVIINLLVNAVHACKEKGMLNIVTRDRAGSVEIRIEDDGCGMPEEVMKDIFTPFYTTKDVGEGTGLGLSVSHGVVERHGGSISVESEVGKGTCFTLNLPVVNQISG